MDKEKRTALGFVMQAINAQQDLNIILGIPGSTLEMDSFLLESIRGIIDEGGDDTITVAFVACCHGGFRETAIEILRSGQVSAREFRGPDGFLRCLNACSIPVDEIPEGLMSKFKRMQRGKHAFGM